MDSARFSGAIFEHLISKVMSLMFREVLVPFFHLRGESVFSRFSRFESFWLRIFFFEFENSGNSKFLVPERDFRPVPDPGTFAPC